MDDLISRQAAIDIFDDYNVSVESGELEAYSRDRKRLCELPSAQPDPKWIPFGQSAENDEDRATDDQIADSGKMIKLKKRTITERLIIANSLIAGAIADSDNKDVSDTNVGDISTEPEIIRCKDCKYSEKWYRDKSRCFLWNEDGIDVFDAGFCNYAKRRTDDGE